VLSSSDEGTLSLGLVPTDLNAILRECCNAAAPRLKEQGISLRFVASDVRLLASVDAFRITQMFNILLENTVRYTDAPGEMRVRFEQLSADAVTLIVEDSAPGVPPELHARLFDRLFRVEQSRSRHSGGSGLGLAIFQALARAHNATVQAVSSSLGGLAIRTTFPLLIAEVIDEQS
jgi:two-component system, OmpR family, sensor histidine kinase BaeS